jgi:hypothetical protein
MAPVWKGPYSSDDEFEDFTKGMSRDSSYPTRKPNVYGDGPPCYSIKGDTPYGAIDLSGTIDQQVKYGYGFDDNKSANWSADKSADGLGGFSGDVLPAGRAGNHPTRSSLNARGKAGPQVGGKNR